MDDGPGESLPSIVVVGDGFEVSGNLPEAGLQRVSDYINERRPMLVLENARLVGCATFGETASELAVNRSAVLFIVPILEEGPTSNREMLVEKQRHRVRARIGEWVVEGDIHVAPQVTVERFVNMGHTEFVPMTDVHLVGPEGERSEPLVLVARSHLALFMPLDASDRQVLAHPDI